MFIDSTFAALIMGLLALGLGEKRTRNLSPHSWRVWLATALKKLGASDPLIMAFGRWLNPESVKIYARLGVAEYAKWMNKMMKVQCVDSTRTTNLLDEDDLLGEWADALPERETAVAGAAFDKEAEAAPAADVRLNKGTRVEIYWTEMDNWYTATVTSSRKEVGDDGRLQVATRVVYDPVDRWGALAYWHCLDDERWRHIDATEPRTTL